MGGSLLSRAAACALAVALAAPVSHAHAQKQGGTLSVGTDLDIPGFDPVKVGVFDVSALTGAALIFETLTRMDDRGVPQPRLSTSWTHADDYKTWTFKLRPGVTFTDGTPFNAQAVVFNYARMKDPKNHCACAVYISGIQSVEAPDDLTVAFKLSQPVVAFPELLSLPASTNVVQSPTAVQKLGEDYNRHPVGTGAFVIKSWAAGDRMVLVPNPNYWDKKDVHLDQVVLRPLPDGQSRYESLLAGQTDVIYADSYEPDHIRAAEKNEALEVLSYTGSGANVDVFNTKSPPLDDLRVRQGLVMALDKTLLSKVLTEGLAKPASNPYGDGSWVQCHSDDGALPYDPKKAAELLKQHGAPVRFSMLVTASPRGRMVGQVLQQLWQRVGATVDIEQVDRATIPARAFTHQFQVTPWLIIDLADPQPQVFANFFSKSPVNLAQYSNPELDKLLIEAGAVADRAKRTADYCAIARIINQEATWFWTFQNTYFALAKKSVHGIPKMYSGLLDVSRASID